MAEASQALKADVISLFPFETAPIVGSIVAINEEFICYAVKSLRLSLSISTLKCGGQMASSVLSPIATVYTASSEGTKVLFLTFNFLHTFWGVSAPSCTTSL